MQPTAAVFSELHQSTALIWVAPFCVDQLIPDPTTNTNTDTDDEDKQLRTNKDTTTGA